MRSRAAFQDAPVFSEPDEDLLVCALALDESRGADGVLATNDIRSIADLKGRSVAVLRGSLQQFYLERPARERPASARPTSRSSICPPRMPPQAFMMREVDAAVTYEPWLTPGENTAHGHLLTDTLGAARADHRLPG